MRSDMNMAATAPKMERSLVLITKRLADISSQTSSMVERIRSIADNIQGPTPTVDKKMSEKDTPNVMSGDVSNIRGLITYIESQILELDAQIQRLESL